MSKKYRPYLSLPMLERIVSSVKANSTEVMSHSHIDEEIISSLEVLILKARHEITKPSYTPLSSKLGMPTSPEELTGPSYRYHNNLMTQEEREAYETELNNSILSSLPPSSL